MKSDSVQFRTRIVGAAFFLFAALLIGQLYLVQVVRGDDYEADAVGQYKSTAPDTDRRGAIFFTDRDGELVSAAVMQTGWRVAVKAADIEDPEALYRQLGAITPVDRERFMAGARKQGRNAHADILFRLDDATAEHVRTLKAPGVVISRDQWRFYPARELAAQTVGFVGYKGDRKTGVYGLERQWQETLSQESDGLYVNPFAEIFANVGALLSQDPSSQQGDIVTAIEPSVQKQLEVVLQDVMAQYAPRRAGAIVMDPKTGEIRAMALRPSFDPNEYNLVDDPADFANPLVEGRYEMGSIVKPLTVAAGIDTGAITPQTKYNDIGCLMRSEKRICNHDHKARGVVPMQEVLSQSLNLGVTYIEEKMGQEVFRRYLHEFGLDTKTGIDLPGEVVGSLASVDAAGASDVDFATASFGQGIAISPIAMTRALAALANGGVMSQPHVTTAVRLENGVTKEITSAEGVRVLQPESAETVTRMLVEVVDTALLKGKYKQDHYSIAAKTGTAQIAIPGGGGYYGDRYLHSFFGYFPAYDPQFIIFLYAVEPHGAEFASATLAQPFMEMTQFLIHYYNIPPDR
ncbi:penicillin-binding protein 2 [Candidatus Kaiserbacteria bacterium]|nr:penicillin-binding protein 2 [Candidatus Kaiserbacteria bacterium]